MMRMCCLDARFIFGCTKAFAARCVWVSMLVGIFFGSLLSTVPSSAHAASLERLNDRRVIVNIFGEKLSFRTEDASNVEFLFTGPPDCDSKYPTPTLKRWLDDPSVAACLEHRLADTSGRAAVMIMHFTTRGPLDFPGAITQADFPGGIIGTDISIMLRHPATGQLCVASSGWTADKLDYQTRPLGKSPKTECYKLPAKERLGNASRPLCVGCSGDIGQSAVCSVNLASKNNSAGLSLSWIDFHFNGPTPLWIKYDAAARKIADSIFVARPSGDLQ